MIGEKLPYAAVIEIGLLTGADCAKALETKEVMPSTNGGPFAFMTTFGCCVIGPLAKLSKKNSISCHRIIVQDLSSNFATSLWCIK